MKPDPIIARYARSQVDVVREVLLSAGEIGNWHTVEELAQLTRIKKQLLQTLIYRVRDGEFAVKLEIRPRGRVREYRAVPK